MIAFIIHDAVSSSDTVMFAESFEAWWANYTKETKAVFQKTGKVIIEFDGNEYEEFGRIHCLDYLENNEMPKDYDDYKAKCKENNWKMIEPEYVQAKTINENTVLRFGG